MKYAIVESGGKQYKAVEGAIIEVDKLLVEIGKKLDLSEVLLINDGKKVSVGTPLVKDAKVKTTVVDQFKAPKILVFKYKSRQRYRVKQGHRQQYTRLQIDEILMAGSKAKAEAVPKAETKAKAETKPKAKATPKAETKPKAESKPKAEAKPKAESKPKAKPKAKAKPKTAAKPAAKDKK